MSRSIRAGLGVSLALAAALALTLTATSERAADVPAPRAAGGEDIELGAIELELDRLRRAVDELARDETGQTALDTPAVSDRESGLRGPARRVDRDASGEDPVQAHADAMEGLMDTQDIDMAWSDWASTELADSFESSSFDGAYLVDTECRSTLCRVEIDFSSASARDEAITALPLLASWDGQGFFQVTGEDQLGVIAYYAREDVDLPRG